MANEPGNRTDYHELYKPVDGEDGTGDNYRNDMDHIDRRLIKFGDISERPSEAPDTAVFVEDETSSGDPGAQWRYDASTGEWVKQPINTDVVSAESLTTQSVDTERVFSNAVTMYVRTDGSDSNDGLSPSSAKATVNSAIRNAPINGDAGLPLVIDIEAGTFTDDENIVEVRDSSIPHLHLRGEVDGSNNPATVLDASGQTYGVVSEGPRRITVENCHITGAQVCAYARGGTFYKFVNSKLSDSSRFVAEITNTSSAVIDSNSLLDNTMRSDAAGNLTVVGCASCKVEGEVVGTGGGQDPVYGKQNSYIIIVDGGRVDGNGSANCIFVVDSTDCKMGLNTTYANASVACRAERGCTTKTPDFSTITLENVNRAFNVSRGSHVHDETSDSSAWGIPKQNGDPSLWDLGGPANGWLSFDLDIEKPKFYAANEGAWLEGGKKLIKDGSLTVPSGGEQLVTVATGATRPLEVNYGFANTPNAGVDIEYSVRYGGGDTRVFFKETSGAGGADVTFTIYEDIR
ncbi:hypothetical protein SAMN05421858_5045 [Haladaptatus litoreus]|uniref:Uncharacterized protein n=1 Tax=Haladaptatus litoreus TaxID=553468 RepID=A0A1N7FGQ1_9EURY|nr:hypothetical protein [Haladaptatus litoreus]SIR99608.1 hypothetical protein SAMN05421858_5045 [Haladaptatus litoreus]